MIIHKMHCTNFLPPRKMVITTTRAIVRSSFSHVKNRTAIRLSNQEPNFPSRRGVIFDIYENRTGNTLRFPARSVFFHQIHRIVPSRPRSRSSNRDPNRRNKTIGRFEEQIRKRQKLRREIHLRCSLPVGVTDEESGK